MSTFRGIEMAKQALFTQRSGLYTTGHNIANANTEGYSRQRVNFETRLPTPNASRNRQEIPGQLGTGVQAGSVERIRNQFLDVQFRAENSKSGYYGTRNEALVRMENILNEPSDTGLSASMNQFWQSLQDLSVNPENSGARSVVLQRGEALADTFNYLSHSLSKIRTDLQNQMEVTLKEANTILTEINNINQEVRKLETHGYTANDLYDKRDLLLDQLSEIVPIKVEYDKPAFGDGVATVTLVDNMGNSYTGQDGTPIVLVDGNNDTIHPLKVELNEQKVVSDIKIGDNLISASQLSRESGSLGGYIQSFGYVENGEMLGDYPTTLSKLDKIAFNLVEKFNSIHGEPSFFESISNELGAASVISVALDDPTNIHAGDQSGSGENALKLANVFYEEVAELNDSSILHYYESVIGEMGVDAEHVKRMNENTTILRSQVENQRMSVSSVSIDEELTNMLKFQHAYNAAARSMTATDELLDRIINSMGLVGR